MRWGALAAVLLLVEPADALAAPPGGPVAESARAPRIQVVGIFAGDGEPGATGDGDAVLREALNRLRFELVAAGLAVADADHPPDYVIALARSDQRVVGELRPVGSFTAAPAVRRIELATAADQDPATVAAVRAVEWLRATILQPRAGGEAVALPASARVAPKAAAIQQPPPPLPTESGRRFAGGLGLGVLQSLGGLNTGLGPAARFEVQLRGRLSARLSTVGPAFARDQSVGGVSLSLWQIASGVGLAYALRVLPAARPTLTLTGGAYVYSVSDHGSATPTESTSGVVPFASVGLGVSVVRRGPRALWLQAEALFMQPSLHVTVHGAEAGRTGRPLLLIGLLIDYQAIAHGNR